MARLHGAAFVMPRPWSAGEIAVLLSSPLWFVVSEPQGFAMGRVVAGEAELLTIAVDPMAQGQGIGARLMRAFLGELQQRGAESVFLEVADTNAPARALYARAGFAVTGRRRGYYHAPDGSVVDAVLMARRIGTEPEL